MSWPEEQGRDPHVAYVVYEPNKQKYITFISPTNILWSESLCHATMFPTMQQAQSKIDYTPFEYINEKVTGLVVKKVILE